MLPKIIAVVGPTASGKTDLGVFLAQELGGEIVSADAKQVYRGMDIGTAKEKDLPVPQHLIDIKDPGERITVAEYQGLAYAEIDRLLAVGRVPVLVGGSGLYAESVLNGYQFSADGKSLAQVPRYASLKLGIQIDRAALKERAAARTKRWLDQGLLDEIRGLIARGVDPAWLCSCGMEYRYFTLYLQGTLSLDEATAKTIISINQFIKRQYTWWRRHPDLIWVESREEALGLSRKFLAG